MTMHRGQLDVSVETVRRLVREQFPAWAGLAIKRVASQGTVNALFRIGDGLAARFPLQPGEPESVQRWLESEAQAARELVGRTRFRTPEPVAIGRPGAGYPLPWSVQTWITGTAATDDDPGRSVPFAHDLAEFVLAVRALDTHGRRFTGPGRGGDLRRHDEWVDTCLQRSGHLVDVARLRWIWAELRTLPRPTAADTMTHGDLTPANVLVRQGRLAGVLDVGGLGPADPALDLVGAWHLLETGPRNAMRRLLGCDDLEWARGQAWAFEQAIGLLWYYETSNPTMSRIGRRTIHRIVAAWA
jgi:aminoglycoside phosphotransferase (APT) family kinase protein